MNSDDMRRILATAAPPSDAEAAAAREQMRSDPVAARQAVLAVFGMASAEPALRPVVDAVLKFACLQLVLDAMEGSDEFALTVGRALADRLTPTRVPRGKAKTA